MTTPGGYELSFVPQRLDHVDARRAGGGHERGDDGGAHEDEAGRNRDACAWQPPGASSWHIIERSSPAEGWRLPRLSGLVAERYGPA